MAFLNILGFETGDLSEAYSTFGSAGLGGPGRTGSWMLQYNTAGGRNYFEVGKLDANGAAALLNVTTLYSTWYLKLSSLPGGDCTIAIAAGVAGGGNEVCHVVLNSSGQLRLVNGGGSASGNTAALGTGTWYRLDLTAVKNATCSLQVDGGTAVTVTGSNQTINLLQIGTNLNSEGRTINVFYDDVALSNSSLPGPGEVHGLLPNGVGAVDGWTGSAGGAKSLLVDDWPHNSDTDYVSSTGTAQRFAMDSAATGGVSGTIGTVKGIMAVKRQGAAGALVRIQLGTSAGVDVGGSHDPGASYVLRCWLRDTDPNDAAAWTTTDIDNAEVGVQQTGGIDGDFRVSAFLVTVWCNPITLASSAENLAVNVSESDAVSATAGDSDSLGVKITEADGGLEVVPDADSAGANTTDADAALAIEPAADSDSAAVDLTEADDALELAADADTAAAKVTEADAAAATAGDVDTAAAKVSETDSAAYIADLTDTLALNVSEANAIEVTGEFPPLRLRVDVYDPAGSKLNAGPITSILGASYRLELDRIGSFAFQMPAGDGKADLVAQGNEVRIYREGEGLVFRGLVDRAEWVIAADGSLVLSASGSSIARRLAWENTLLGRAFDGASLSSAVTTLLAGTGWTAGSLDVPATTLLARFDGLPIWAALAKVAEVFGRHLREDPWNKEVDVGAFGATSGLVLQNVEAVSPALRQNRLLAPIAKLQVLEESADLWNRVIPLGAGEGVNKLDLRYATRSSPYAVQSATGPDGRTYWYLEDAASVAAYGRRTRVLSVKDALPLANSSAGFTAAANALYDVAATWLARHKDGLTSYAVEALGLRHLAASGAPAFQVGDRLRLVYRGLAQRSDGTTGVWKSVDASLWLMGLQRTFNDDGSDTWDLTVSTVDRQEEDETSRLAAVFEDMRALQVSLRPYTYREIHGPERRSVDPTHGVTFVVDYDANVSYLHQALLSVAVKPVRTNASGASSGGGSVATSGGGSSHSHTVSGQSASAGGGQTSSVEATHTHTVTGQSANAAGTHRHQMFAAIGSGGAATSSVPDVASTQLESATHYHNGSGAGFPNVGSHSHSLSNHRHTVNNYQVAGKNSTGSANVSFWMILPDGQAFNPVYTYEAATDHTHTVTGTTSSAGAAHTHTVADHTHGVTATTSSAETSHTHSVTVPAHTHALLFGIYEGAGPTAGADVTVAINGTDRTAALGGPFDTDFLAKDITQYLQDAQGHPLRQRNTVVFTAGELLDLEIVCKSLVTATSLVPV